MLLIIALLSILGTSLAQVDPVGPQIKLQVTLSTGGIAYVENAVNNEFTTTDSVANAAIFTADESTGFLYQATTNLAQFPSGYAVPAVTTQDLLGLLELTGYDADVVTTQSGYYPLTCSGNLNLLGLAQLTIPLLCTNTGLANLVTGFGICPALDNHIVNFGLIGSVDFLLQCGLDAPLITGFNAILYVSPTVPTPTSAVIGPGGLPTPVNPSTCSVTVSIIVTTTTVFVPAGYAGPSTLGSGGSTTGPNPYGCQPITSILGI
ncbi:hypothetical protein N0V93_008296 [Gnomoniopsis smithogilvyi]|uniref:Thaumatin-like protein n=1 Tax=Gnomoniopsis smithogilvyi TaxID=1191159 RepID=A0A9W8YLQ9_9PEZI|nr:hypothetical protein N0V93_008296 [Gnomoniopsis smithogilvyi]